MRPPGHSGKAKKGHLCFDAIYETGENILIDHLFILKNCLQEILEELISSTIMNMTCSFGRTLATLDTGNQNDRFVSILQILLQISTINAGIMTANKSMPPSLHHTGYNHCTQQPTCTVMQHTGFQIKIFSFNPKSYGCSFGNTKHPYVA